MTAHCQRGRDEGRDTTAQRDRGAKIGRAVLELHGSRRDSGGGRRRAHRCSERHRLPGRGRVRCCGQSGGGCRFDEELPRDREEVRFYDTHARSANIRSAEAEEIVLTAGDAVVDRRMADEPGRRRRRGVPPQKWPYIGLNKHEIEGTCGWGGAASPIIG